MSSRCLKKIYLYEVSQIWLYILKYVFNTLITICMFTELSQVCEEIWHVLKHLLNLITCCRITFSTTNVICYKKAFSFKLNLTGIQV